MGKPPGWLRWLIMLFPPGHRRRYGAEMWEVVRYRFETGSGARRRWRLELAVGADLLWSVVGVWRTTTGGWFVKRYRELLTGFGLDVRFMFRSLRRSPGYAATAIVVLAGAVAVNAAVYSFVRGTLLDEPAYADPQGVMIVWGSNTVDGQLRDVISGPTYIDLAERTRTLDPIAAFHLGSTYLTGEGRPEVVDALEITVDFLDVLGVRPVLGRGFDERDRTSSAPATVLLSYAFWRDRYGSDPGVVGSAIQVEGEPHTILGVLPPSFRFLAPTALYLPLRDDVLAADGRYRIHYNAVGRLAGGATASDATRELTVAMQDIQRVYTGFEGWSILVEPLRKTTVSAVRPVIWILVAIVGLVLLIALVNLATLFRMRTLARADELGIRIALGAGRGSLARVFGLEVLGLAAAGAVSGLAVTPFLLTRVTALVPPWIPIPDSAVRTPSLVADLDPGVVAVAFGAAVLGAVALTAPGFVSALRRGGLVRRQGVMGIRGTRLLVGVELALATVMCLGAALTARSAANLLGTDVGFEDRGLLALWVGDVWDRPAEAQVAYFQQIVEQVEALPAVQSAAVIDYVDFEAEDDYAGVTFLDRSMQRTSSVREQWRRVSEGLFETAGMRIIAGRSFGSEDFVGRPKAAIVNQAFAHKHYPDGNVLGQYLSTHEEAYSQLEIVGIVADLHSLGPSAPPPPMLYVPNQGAPRGTQGMYVRVRGEPMAQAAAVRDAIWSVDPSQPLTGLAPMSDRVNAWVAIPRATRALVSWLAIFAILLAAVGLFGVVAYVVRSRRSELGVRLALGATPARLKVDVILGALPVLLAGVAVGLLSGVLAARGARAILFHVNPLDPVSVALAVVAMCAAALLAVYLPARRVTAIDPSEAMRAD